MKEAHAGGNWTYLKNKADEAAYMGEKIAELCWRKKVKPFLDEIARERCAKILASEAARALPKEAAEALVTISFVYGAAWALDQPDMIEFGNAQIDALRNTQQ